MPPMFGFHGSTSVLAPRRCSQPDDDRQRLWCGQPAALLLLLLVGASALALPGCGGCRPGPQAQKKTDDAAKKPPPPPPFTVASLRLDPHDETSPVACKPSHWTTAALPIRANRDDFRGDVFCEAVDRDGRLLDLERAPYQLRLVRPASLPRGQVKHFELLYFVPRRPDASNPITQYQWRLCQEGSGRTVMQRQLPVVRMPAHQYNLVVLARSADSYGWIKRLDAVRAPWQQEEFLEDAEPGHYRVVVPQVTERSPPPLPGHSLAWTSIAYVLWDDIDPDLLRPDQKTAMLDWLHWGGQVIVSGPGSLDSLRAGFLAPYLPAEAGSSVELTDASFAALNDTFSLRELLRGREMHERLQDLGQTPVRGVELRLREGAAYVAGTGSLLAERRAGRGRIVVTAFPLNDRRVVNWRHVDNFFNACLLRRPPRAFRSGPLGDPIVAWADAELAGRRADPRLITAVRYFSRDLGSGSGATGVAGATGRQPGGDDLAVQDTAASASAPAAGAPASDPPRWLDPPDPERGFVADAASGVGGWSDQSGASEAARQALKEAAGIAIPRASFVLQMLAAYLVVLVPLNWAVFRVIGRVEWAWIAAPLIALGGGAAVVRLAQLDIGFARSRTEIAILEVHGGYHRGHLTRYTALYTSLSTGYDVHFDDGDSLALPFAADPQFRRLMGQSAQPVLFRRDHRASLRGLHVASNSTGMVHGEQMFDLGGSIGLSGSDARSPELTNGSQWPLQGAALIRRVAGGKHGRIETAWLGDVAAGESVRVRFAPPAGEELAPQWESLPTTRRDPPEGELSLRRLIDLASDPRHLAVGDVRLVAYTDRPLPGVTIVPSAAQSVQRTLVVAHLTCGPLPDPRSDANTRRDAAGR